MQTPLSQLFATERHRPRAGAVGLSVPLASEVDVTDGRIEPLMITSTRGTFLQSKIASGGYVRFGFSECPLASEGGLVYELYKQLVILAGKHQWGCVAKDPYAAVEQMRANGETPFHFAAGPWLETDEIGSARVLDVGLPQGVALLVTSPDTAGLHTRIGDHVGVIAYRVNRAFVAVVPP